MITNRTLLADLLRAQVDACAAVVDKLRRDQRGYNGQYARGYDQACQDAANAIRELR